MAWNKPDRDVTARQSKAPGRGTRIAVRAAVVVAFAGTLFITARHFLSAHPPHQTAPELAKPALIAEVIPATNAASTVLKTEPDSHDAVSDLRNVRKKIAALPKQTREELAYEEMKNKPLDLTPKTNRAFKTGTEISMSRIFMTRLGDPPPPLFTTLIPPRDAAHLAEILIADNPALETDTEKQREAKEMVELAKKEMAAYIKDGGAPEGFLSYYHGKLQEAFDMRRESMMSLMKVAREEPEIAGEYLERLNKSLSEKGIREIELTEKQRKRLGME